MGNAARDWVDAAPVDAHFRPFEFGGHAATQALLRLARDPKRQMVRAAKGLYVKLPAPDPMLGKQRPSPVEVAKRVAQGRGVGPAGGYAAAQLGLTSQVAPQPTLAIVGRPPTGVDGVRWQTRSNPARAQLGFTEVAVVELLSLVPSAVEAPWEELVATVARLRDRDAVRLDEIERVVAVERRKPALQRNLARLPADLPARRSRRRRQGTQSPLARCGRAGATACLG